MRFVKNRNILLFSWGGKMEKENKSKLYSYMDYITSKYKIYKNTKCIYYFNKDETYYIVIVEIHNEKLEKMIVYDNKALENIDNKSEFNFNIKLLYDMDFYMYFKDDEIRNKYLKESTILYDKDGKYNEKKQKLMKDFMKLMKK